MATSISQKVATEYKYVGIGSMSFFIGDLTLILVQFLYTVNDYYTGCILPVLNLILFFSKSFKAVGAPLHICQVAGPFQVEVPLKKKKQFIENQKILHKV